MTHCAINCGARPALQLVRTLTAWRPDLTAFRDVESAYRISLKSLARRCLELHDETVETSEGAFRRNRIPSSTLRRMNSSAEAH